MKAPLPLKIYANGPSKREKHGRIFCRVGVVMKQKVTEKASLWQLRSGQIINQVKVKPDAVLWIPNSLFFDGVFMPMDKHIWVEESFYNKIDPNGNNS